MSHEGDDVRREESAFDREYRWHAEHHGAQNIKLTSSGLVGGHGGEWVREYYCEACQSSWTEREPR